jgi:hypothetical protein
VGEGEELDTVSVAFAGGELLQEGLEGGFGGGGDDVFEGVGLREGEGTGRRC